MYSPIPRACLVLEPNIREAHSTGLWNNSMASHLISNVLGNKRGLIVLAISLRKGPGVGEMNL